MIALENILQGCKNNDRVCQEKLYMHVYDAMYNLCNRFFSDDQDIVSAINNGMLRVFKNIHLYNNEKSDIQTWVYSIVRNEALTIVRNRKNILLTKEIDDEIHLENEPNPFNKSVMDDVYVYLGKLSETTRVICNLHYLENYSVKEVAATLDMKEGTVKWHLSEGRKKLQALFKVNNIQQVNVG